VRAPKILSGLLAVPLSLCLALTLLGAAPANAAPKPTREVSGKVINVTQQKLAYKGKVFGSREPTYRDKVTYLQRKTCKSCNWRRQETNRTDRNARFRYRVGAPRTGSWYYRVVVPESREYRKSFSPVYRTFRL